MPTKQRRKLVLSSSMTMRFGILLACFAWIMHIVPLLTPLWDENATLGHGICIQLAPVVSVAKQHQQAQTDIIYIEHNLPSDNADHHSHHHIAPNALVPPPTVEPIIATNAKSSSEALHSAHNVGGADPDSIQHISCDLCISMSAVIVPEVFAHTEPDSIELFGLFVTFLHHSNIDYPNNFLRPLVRAPPQAIIT